MNWEGSEAGEELWNGLFLRYICFFVVVRLFVSVDGYDRYDMTNTRISDFEVCPLLVAECCLLALAS